MNWHYDNLRTGMRLMDHLSFGDTETEIGMTGQHVYAALAQPEHTVVSIKFKGGSISIRLVDCSALTQFPYQVPTNTHASISLLTTYKPNSNFAELN